MNFKKKLGLFFLFSVLSAFVFSFGSSAVSQDESAVQKFYSDENALICISHRGDTEAYPENSLQAVKSALEKGADFVSVNLEKTADGVFYLCESESLSNICNADADMLSELNSDDVSAYRLYDIYGNLTDYEMTSLVTLLENTEKNDGIILDVNDEDKDSVYNVLKENNALSRVIIRVRTSGKKLSQWALSKEEKVYVVGKYTGNIIFSTISSINSLTQAEMPAVQYESKNYFNVCYGEFFANRYLTGEKTRAIAATYSPDICGQRSDGSDGWNELIGKGYSAVETNNVEAFVQYAAEAERIEGRIEELLGKCSGLDVSKYSQVSLDNLEKAKAECEKLLSASVFSLDEAQSAYSELLFAFKDMKVSSGEVETKGALNVTAGKIVATVLVGAALFAGQVYVYKMRRIKKEK